MFLGAAVVGGVLAFTLAGAWTQHDDESKAYADDVMRAIKKAQMTQFEASVWMWGDDKHEQLFCNMLAGRMPLHAYRLCKLPASFQKELLKLRAQRLGMDIVEPGMIAELLAHLRALVPHNKKEVA